MRYEIAGIASLDLDLSRQPGLDAFVRSRMDPYLAASDTDVAGPPDMVVRAASDGATHRRDFLQLQNDAGDGLTTAWDGSRTYVLRRSRWCAVPDAVNESPATFELQAGFPLVDIWEPLVRPALSLVMLRHRAVTVHASAVELDGRVVLVAGWSESGKTEVALALAETGALFVSDKWTVVREDGRAAPYPISAGVRRWVVPFLPKVEAELSPLARVQFTGAAVASRMLPAGHRGAMPRLVHEALDISHRAVGLADRVSMASSRVRRIYGGIPETQCLPLPLAACVLLTTTPGPSFSLQPIEAAIAAERLARAAAFERRAYFSIGERARYAADGQRLSSADEVIALETDLLSKRLDGITLLEARAPFPADPRGLARAIRKALG